jgi:hypothetical protein
MSGAAALICERRGAEAWSGDLETFLAIRAAWHVLIDQAVPDMPMDLKAELQALRDQAPAALSAPKYTDEIGLLNQPSSSDEAAREAQEAEFKEWLDRAEAVSRRVQEIERLGQDVGELFGRLRRPPHEDR